MHMIRGKLKVKNGKLAKKINNKCRTRTLCQLIHSIKGKGNWCVGTTKPKSSSIFNHFRGNRSSLGRMDRQFVFWLACLIDKSVIIENKVYYLTTWFLISPWILHVKVIWSNCFCSHSCKHAIARRARVNNLSVTHYTYPYTRLFIKYLTR